MKNTLHFKSALDYPNRTSNVLFLKINKHKQILEIVRSALPHEIAKHLTACVINDKKLILYCKSASWASQLRFYHTLIRTVAAEKIADPINAIQIRIFVQANIINEPIKQHRHYLPSFQTISSLHNNALAVSDNTLKEALLRLLKTLELRTEKS